MSTNLNNVANSSDAIFKHIHKDLTELWSKMNASSRQNNTNVPYGFSSSDIANLEISVSDSKRDIIQLHGIIKSITSSKDEQAIKFNKLGFKSFDEAGLWYTTNAAGDYFGLVVDFHTLMENINNKMTTVDVMAKLEHAYKIKLDDLSQATSMGSYESEVPKVLMKEVKGSQNIIKGDESHFTNIKTWDAWDMAHDGIRPQIEEHLSTYHEGQLERIHNLLDPTDAFYQIAVLSLSTSVSFITSLISFLDSTYRTYVRAKFNTKRAWHIATRLTKRLIVKVYKPRHGVYETFKAGSPVEIGKAIFYSTLRCLDIMQAMTKLQFGNDPAIANELVKFLSLNSEFDKVNQLEADNIELKKELKLAQKDMSEAVKSVQTISNKFDQYKTSVESLKKRVSAVENKPNNNQGAGKGKAGKGGNDNPE